MGNVIDVPVIVYVVAVTVVVKLESVTVVGGYVPVVVKVKVPD